MSNVPSVTSSPAAYASEAPTQHHARTATAETPAVSTASVPTVSDTFRDRLDPNSRQAESAINDASNPTVARYLAMEYRRKRDNRAKPPLRQMFTALKPKSKSRRAMEKLMRNEAALKDELRSLNGYVDNEWKSSQACYAKGDLQGAKVHARQVIEYTKQAERMRTELRSVQDCENAVVEQVSSSRLMRVHDETTRALKQQPNVNLALQERLEVLDKVKDRNADNNDLLRENIEVAADDEDAAMQVIMDRLGASTQVGLEAAPVLPTKITPVHVDNDQWQPVYE